MDENGDYVFHHFTKTDKLKPKGTEQNVEAYTQELLKNWEETPTYFITSSTSSVGCGELLQHIDLEINMLRNN